MNANATNGESVVAQKSLINYCSKLKRIKSNNNSINNWITWSYYMKLNFIHGTLFTSDTDSTKKMHTLS